MEEALDLSFDRLLMMMMMIFIYSLMYIFLYIHNPEFSLKSGSLYKRINTHLQFYRTVKNGCVRYTQIHVSFFIIFRH